MSDLVDALAAERPDDWPTIGGKPLELADVFDIMVRKQQWCDDVEARGIDAAPYPITVEEENAWRAFKAIVGGVVLAHQTEQFINRGAGTESGSSSERG